MTSFCPIAAIEFKPTAPPHYATVPVQMLAMQSSDAMYDKQRMMGSDIIKRTSNIFSPGPCCIYTAANVDTQIPRLNATTDMRTIVLLAPKRNAKSREIHARQNPIGELVRGGQPSGKRIETRRNLTDLRQVMLTVSLNISTLRRPLAIVLEFPAMYIPETA